MKVLCHESNDKKKLYVYECLGAGYPGSEPSCEGFLGLWPESPFFYLFFDRDAARGVTLWVQEQKGWSLRGTYQLDYDQWQQVPAREQREIGPFRIQIGTGEAASSEVREGIPIVLEPGVVFGSGLHPTTKGCLKAIAELFADFPIRTVVDLGTGTGILALGCALLGAQSVWALDCNPLAVRVAAGNIRANHLEHLVRILVAKELSVLRSPADLLVMNIEWPCLKKVLQEDSSWSHYRWVILSGFLDSQWEELKKLLPKSSRILLRKVLDDWCTLVLDNGQSFESSACRESLT